MAVLVPSYDDYADIWPIAAELFTRFWPDREWPVYWLTNGANVPSIATPLHRPKIEREQWGANIADALEEIDESLVLFWVEEILLLSDVPNDVMLEAAEILRTQPHIGIIGLTRYYKRARRATIGSFARCRKYTAAFTSALPALFRKEVLIRLLRTLPKPNDFEQQSHRVMAREMREVGALMPARPMFRFCDNALVFGRWKLCAIEHLKEMGFTVDIEARGIFPDACRFMEGTPA